MGALIQYYSISAKRRRKREEEAAAAATIIVDDLELGEAAPILLSEDVPPEQAPVLNEDTPPAAPAPTPAAPPAAAPEAEAPTQGDSDIIGAWFIRIGGSYHKVPIRRTYQIVSKTGLLRRKKILSLNAGGDRDPLSALALLSVWPYLKKEPVYSKKLPPNMSILLTKGDVTEISHVLTEMAYDFCRLGAGHYTEQGENGRLTVNGDRVPPYWDDLIKELDSQIISSSSSVRLKRPKNIILNTGGGRNLELNFEDVLALVDDQSITHFDILRRKLASLHTKGGKTPAQQQPQAQSNPFPPPTWPTGGIDTSIEPPVVLKTVRKDVFAYLNYLWEKGTYSASEESRAYEALGDYLSAKTAEVTSPHRVKGPASAEALNRRVLSRLQNIHLQWNDMFHSSLQSNDWTNPKYALKGVEHFDENLSESALQNLLMEVTFRKLMALTQTNGKYAVGGLVRIGNSWVTDPHTPGRTQNSHFVVTKPPIYKQDTDGLTRIDYNFKSKPDRSTTGMRQKGYIKFIPPGFIKKMLQKIGLFKSKGGWDSDVHVFCSCPDFKFKWHKVLADKKASHVPTGQNGEAINQFPNQTNPSGKLSLCKHLAAMAGYLATTQRDTDDYLSHKQNITPTGVNTTPTVVNNASVDTSA